MANGINMDNEEHKDAREHWEDKARKLLLGRKIVSVEWMTNKEADKLDWYSRPVCLLLDNNTWIYPQRDDEGNDGGALFVINKDKEETLPVF